ncbi:MAG: replicative DNA helicase [Phycisphaerales bacterium]|nr:replicative DNA helicase [Phycisphaerales bacterium]
MCLLGSMILDHEVISDVISLVKDGTLFYRESNGAIFDALVKLHDQHHAGDINLLLQALADLEVLDQVGGPEYIVELAQSVPSAANARFYARHVHEKAKLRKLIDAAGSIMWETYHLSDFQEDSAQSILDRAEQQIFDIASQVTEWGDNERLEDLLQQTMDLLMKNEGRAITGIASGFYDLDEMTSGLQAGEMIILAARPSMGKTALALNLAEQIAAHGRPHGRDGTKAPVAFFSMEMSRQSVTQRLLCAHAGVDSHKLRTNRLGHDDFRRLHVSCGHLSEMPIYVDDTPGLTVLMLRAKARRMVKQYGIRCVVIDYMQLMGAPGAAREGRQQEVSAISRGIKALARELNVPVICLAQLNRGAEQREGHRPRMADLRESGSIEQDADVILLLHRESYYHQGDEDWMAENATRVNEAELIVAKQRNGPTGTVQLTWDSTTTRFKNYAPVAGSAGRYADGGGYQPKREQPSAGGGGSSFGNRPKTGPEEGFRDGGGPVQDDYEDDPDIPI